jgi:undecaprenyl pyrophosphate phosphatase UppP
MVIRAQPGPAPVVPALPAVGAGLLARAGMSYLRALVIAVVQGVTELFPVSSLGHSVLLSAWLGGSWQTMATQSSQQNSGSSFYLASIVAVHCATALALVWFFRAGWARIIRGFCRSVISAAAAAYLSVRFLVRYFQTRTLTPFAMYCFAAGAASIVRFAA